MAVSATAGHGRWSGLVASQLPQLLEKVGPAPLCLRVAVQLTHQPAEIVLQLLYAHAVRHKVHVKQGAQLPGLLIQQATLLPQSPVEGGIGKRGLNRDLYLVQATLVDKIPYPTEAVNAAAVQPQDETAVDTDAVALDLLDGGQVLGPVAVEPGEFTDSRLRSLRRLR